MRKRNKNSKVVKRLSIFNILNKQISMYSHETKSQQMCTLPPNQNPIRGSRSTLTPIQYIFQGFRNTVGYGLYLDLRNNQVKQKWKGTTNSCCLIVMENRKAIRRKMREVGERTGQKNRGLNLVLYIFFLCFFLSFLFPSLYHSLAVYDNQTKPQ